jgi:hypothetical protein
MSQKKDRIFVWKYPGHQPITRLFLQDLGPLTPRVLFETTWVDQPAAVQGDDALESSSLHGKFFFSNGCALDLLDFSHLRDNDNLWFVPVSILVQPFSLPSH